MAAMINPSPDVLDSVDGQPVVFATGELPARLAEQVAGHLLELAKATREESQGVFFG